MILASLTTLTLPLVLAQAAVAEAEAPRGLWELIVQSNFLNFVIAVILLGVLVAKLKPQAMLEKRRLQIIHDMEEAETRRANAAQAATVLEARTAELARDVERMLTDAGQTAAQVAEGILKQAEADAAKIRENAAKRVAQEQKTLSRELEHQLMVDAIHGARQLLESTLSDDDRRRSVSDFIETLPTLANTSGGH